MKINRRIRRVLRDNRFNPLEESFDFRLNAIFKEIGRQLRNSKERNNVKLIKEKINGPQAQKITTQKRKEKIDKYRNI